MFCLRCPDLKIIVSRLWIALDALREGPGSISNTYMATPHYLDLQFRITWTSSSRDSDALFWPRAHQQHI